MDHTRTKGQWELLTEHIEIVATGDQTVLEGCIYRLYLLNLFIPLIIDKIEFNRKAHTLSWIKIGYLPKNNEFVDFVNIKKDWFVLKIKSFKAL